MHKNYKVKICISDTQKPVWGNLDILKACGALDSGSNPGAGVFINVHLLNTSVKINYYGSYKIRAYIIHMIL